MSRQPRPPAHGLGPVLNPLQWHGALLFPLYKTRPRAGRAPLASLSRPGICPAAGLRFLQSAGHETFLSTKNIIPWPDLDGKDVGDSQSLLKAKTSLSAGLSNHKANEGCAPSDHGALRRRESAPHKSPYAPIKLRYSSQCPLIPSDKTLDQISQRVREPTKPSPSLSETASRNLQCPRPSQTTWRWRPSARAHIVPAIGLRRPVDFPS